MIEKNSIEAKLLAERNEMYSRRECARISGVEERREEDVEKIVIDIGRKVGVEIDRRDIAAAHRVGSKKEGKERQIIAKFVNRKDKEKLVQAARKKAKEVDELKGKVYVNEDLTDLRGKMCGLARKCDRVKSVVTVNGNILCYMKEVRHDGKNVVKRIDGPEDLAEVLGESVKVVLKKIGLME